MAIIRFYTSPAFSNHKSKEVLTKLILIDKRIKEIQSEMCYHIELEKGCDTLADQQIVTLQWLLTSPLYPNSLKSETVFGHLEDHQTVIECGPRFNFSTPDSSNSVQICQNVGLKDIKRVEVSKRYLISLEKGGLFSPELLESLSSNLHDRMTQCVYTEDNLPVKSFDEGLPKDLEPWFYVPILKNGKDALQEVNKKLGLAFDDWDIEFYTDLFRNKLRRDPTSVECFDLAQSNSEHSRHWFFKGKLVVDGEEYEESLIDMIMNTQETSNNNNVIKFGDNSSAILGFAHMKIKPSSITGPSRMVWERVESDIIFTAETHNMPTAVAPFSGATTGTGGRLRDVQAVGRGGHPVAGTAGYCVGNLRIPGYHLPWEDNDWKYPENFASPLEIIIEASNGASDYGNKFGEPVITGFVQSYGLENVEKEREEFVKPIMFSGGIGYMPHDMIYKARPVPGNLLVKLGGPVYRIGVGGGAASSVAVQGAGAEEGETARRAALDFGAVQRGDAEMGNRLNRAVRACLEASTNPILSIHDQGAGGNGNVLKELVEPLGAVVYTQQFQLGDPTISVLELWGAEYQENNALLCDQGHRKLLEDICNRERCPVSFVGEVTSDGNVKLVEGTMDASEYLKVDENLPFNLNLEAVLGNMPKKTFQLSNKLVRVEPLALPSSLSVQDALDRVLRLVSVGSKRYLTNKVDRCVTGLVAQQQCVGPLHTPLADCGVIALSQEGRVGAATSLGTQSLKGRADPAAGARLSVGEALTNLVFAGISSLGDVKCSGNWMWSGKTGREGGQLAVACRAMCTLMAQLGIAVDGGKDSLSMAARVGSQRVNSPGTLVVSAYAPCPDITVKVEPYLKQNGSTLIWVPISPGKYRLGGTALAQCFKQHGDSCPDVDDARALKNVFIITQRLLKEGRIVSGHDISDGGLVTCLLEMAFAGLRGIQINVSLPGVGCMEALFSEELGLVLEVAGADVAYCSQLYSAANIQCRVIGSTSGVGMESSIRIVFNGQAVLHSQLYPLLRLWEETSFQLELLQANPECVRQEWEGLQYRKGPTYKVNFESEILLQKSTAPIRVAVVREEGSNGDREMMAALMRAEFEVYDITMYDLLNDMITLDRFRGLVFPGGFSYADTLGSAKGWAASILFNPKLSAQFDHFANTRKNTFSLGVCNGCQLMALLGWLDTQEMSGHHGHGARETEIFLHHNKSERFECRWSCVSISEKGGCPVWLAGMQGAQLGVWVAHGEGRFSFKDPLALQRLSANGQICLQYVNDDGEPTETYPLNPNGSPRGVAGVCSRDGRHLAVMPHPERCALRWQCAYLPPSPSDEGNDPLASPWQRMFYNANVWASSNK